MSKKSTKELYARQFITALSPLSLRFSETSRQVLRGLSTYFINLASIRSGSRISRVFRHIFEHKHTKRFLGSNLALLVLASSFIPNVSSLYASDFEQNVYEAANVLSTSVSVRNPLKSLQINQGYHIFHLGIDFEGITGDPVYSIMDGKVIAVEHSYFAYGNSIVIDHQNGYVSRYAHLSKTNVENGQEVDPFTTIGEVGSTGRSSGDHLHLEVTYEGKNINPLTILPSYN